MNTDLLDEIHVRGWEVPAFDEQMLGPKQRHQIVIIPVINEGERIREQLHKMDALGVTDQFDVAVMDGGSTDGSLDLEFLRSVGVRTLLTKKGPGRLSAQLRCGYAWALIEGYEGIITIDGNGKDGVDTLPEFARALDDGYGYVQASRFTNGGHSENTPLSRLLAIRLIHSPLLSLGAGRFFTDTTQGYRGYSREFLNHPGSKPFRDVFVNYELLAYLTVRASQLGFRVKEIGTSRVYPKDDKIPTKISGFGALLDLMLVALGAVLRVYHPRALAR